MYTCIALIICCYFQLFQILLYQKVNVTIFSVKSHVFSKCNGIIECPEIIENCILHYMLILVSSVNSLQTRM